MRTDSTGDIQVAVFSVKHRALWITSRCLSLPRACSPSTPPFFSLLLRFFVSQMVNWPRTRRCDFPLALRSSILSNPPLRLEDTTATRSYSKTSIYNLIFGINITKRFSNHSKLFLDLSMHLADRLGFITFSILALVVFSFEMLYLRKSWTTLAGDVSLNVSLEHAWYNRCIYAIRNL